MIDSYLKFERNGAAGIVTFTAPQRLNALNISALNELEAELIRLEAKELGTIRALILTGEGKAFIAGADIAEMETLSPAEAAVFSGKGHKVMSRIAGFPIPVIAAVNGFALGGGLETALACDIIYASEKAKMGLPETTLGVIPGFAGSRRLSERIGVSSAKEMIFSGRIIDSEEALRLGLANKICPAETLMEETLKLVQDINKSSPNSIIRAKKLLKRYGIDSPGTIDQLEQNQFSRLFDHPNQKEGMRAFLAREKPIWSTK